MQAGRPSATEAAVAAERPRAHTALLCSRQSQSSRQLQPGIEWVCWRCPAAQSHLLVGQHIPHAVRGHDQHLVCVGAQRGEGDLWVACAPDCGSSQVAQRPAGHIRHTRLHKDQPHQPDVHDARLAASKAEYGSPLAYIFNSILHQLPTAQRSQALPTWTAAAPGLQRPAATV